MINTTRILEQCDVIAGGADHAQAQCGHGGVIRQPIDGERGAVIAPGRSAVDDQRRAAVAADMVHGDGPEGLSRAAVRGHAPEFKSRAWRVKTDLDGKRSGTTP
jgi:hypothetical protein